MDYGYANARIRAMKSGLFNESFYNQLLRSRSLHEVIAALAQTPYGHDLDESMIKTEGLKGFDEALRRNIMKAFSKVSMIVGEQDENLVNVLFGRWDVMNVKTILRGKNLGASSDAILESLIPAGELDEATLLEMVRSRDVRDCIDVMATMNVSYAVPLTGAFPEYAHKRSLAVLELVLDKEFYEMSFAKLRAKDMNTRLVAEMLHREIDNINIMTLLRIVKEEVEYSEAANLFISGGKEVSYRTLVEAVGFHSVEDAVEALKRTSYYTLLQEKMPAYFETNSLASVERGLEEALVRKRVKLFMADPLSIASTIAFIWAKYNEIVNLRIIARGKEVGMPEAKIREALIIA
ncbi:MAG: ATP synthase A1 subunit C [Actinomycetota bacterium]